MDGVDELSPGKVVDREKSARPQYPKNLPKSGLKVAKVGKGVLAKDPLHGIFLERCGAHASSSSYNKLNELQKAENNAYQQRVNADIQHRVDRLPAFNSVYDMNRLSMNTYNQPDTKREIARRWSETFNNTLNYT